MKETTRQFSDGEIIFREGDESLAMFIVRKGKVKLVKAAAGGAASGSVTLATLGKGEMFGEMGILDGVARSASAVAVGAVRVDVTPRHDFLNRLQREPELALTVMTKLVERLRSADEKLAERLPAEPAADPAQAASTPMAISDADEASGKPGLLGRLFGRGKADTRSSAAAATGTGPMRIHVAGFGKDLPPEASETLETLVSILSMIPNAIVKRSDDQVDWPADVTDPEAARLTAARHAVQLLATKGCDLLIWGREEKIGHMLEVHATAAPASHELRMGRMPPVAAVFLPLEELQEPIPALLRAFALSAYMAESGRRSPELSAYLLADVVTSGSDLPNVIRTYAAAEQASTMLAWANAAALCLGMDGTDPEMWQQVSKAYEDAARRLPRNVRDDRADVYIGLGALEITRAERGLNPPQDGGTQWDVAEEVFKEALGNIRQEQRPWDWALLNEKLGLLCYRQASISGDDNQFKAALAHYQFATQVYTRVDHPQKWAEIVSALAQVLQVYGDLLGSIPALERAVELLQATLDVRNQDTMPLLWAASQNNLGSALFLLAKRQSSTELYQDAAEAFRMALTVYQVNGQGRLAAVTEKNLQRVEAASDSRSRRDERLPGWSRDGGAP